MILAGGVGSRFWPASRPERPKQLLPLGSPRPLIVDTLNRARSLAPPERIRILAGGHLVEPFRRALGAEGGEEPFRRALGEEGGEAVGAAAGAEALDELFWVEPRPRGTAPVLVWAAHRLHRADPDSLMISLHSDHWIEPPEGFRDTLLAAAAAARRHDLLFTIAVPPDRPETGYGYLRPGEPLDESGARRIGAFVEKPDLATASRYLDEGYLWNSGIFIWSTARFLEEVRSHAPEVADHLHLLDEGRDESFFERVTPISVDEAVLERSGRVGTVPASFRWDDVGNWDALGRTRDADEAGNVSEGRALLVESSDNVVWAEDGPVVLFGVEGLVVAHSGGVTLVAPRDRAADLKDLMARLPAPLREGPLRDLREGPLRNLREGEGG